MQVVAPAFTTQQQEAPLEESSFGYHLYNIMAADPKLAAPIFA
jgi:hypothetical protein